MGKLKQQIVILDSKQLKVRIGIIAAVLLALVFGWFAVRWQLGNMLASLTSPNDPNASEIGEIAVGFAPGDPLANWLFAATRKNIFSPEAISASVNHYQNVIRHSPYDFRWWIELGRAAEQAERFQDSEMYFQQAIEVAPNYSYPHWQLGNFYLRRSRYDEAFRELKIAAETNPLYRDQVFSLAWQVYDQNKNKLKEIAGESAAVKGSLAMFYAIREKPEDALEIWNSLSEEEKRENASSARVIAQAFYEKRFYKQAIEFYRDLGIEPDAKPETIQNAGFEKTIKDINETFFGWRVSPTDKIEVKLDPTKKQEESRSLRITYSGYDAPALSNVNQIIIVQPSAKYRLSFWVRTENLKSGGTPRIEVLNAADYVGIAGSQPFPSGTNEWQRVQLDFEVPNDPNAAVVLRTGRASCGENCPIYGTIWLDDFKLDRIDK